MSKIKFLYSKTKEKEKLLNICEEYQWFIENSFPIILPEFYDKIYRESKDKQLLSKKIGEELNKIYKKNIYQIKLRKTKSNWQRIEPKFFDVIENLNLNTLNKYTCNISLYGPEGQFKYPDTISLRVDDKDIKNINETIAHEIIHLMVFSKVKTMGLKSKQIEGVVDLFFKETKLKNIFPKYKLQNMAYPDKKLFQKILRELVEN